MTGKEMCEAIVRYRWPVLPDAEVSRLAEKFWNLSPTGELDHVIGEYQQMCLEQVAKGEREQDQFPEQPLAGQLLYRKTATGSEIVCFGSGRWFGQREFSIP